MSVFFVETRELRSFRIKHRTEELRDIIEKKNTEGAFCVTNFLYPVEREEMRSYFNEHNLAVTALAKDIIRLLFKDKKWTAIRSLLEGQIFLIQSKNKNKALTKNFLSILITHEKFTLRLFFNNQQLYRRERLNSLLSLPEQHKPGILIFALCKELMARRTFLLSATKTTYNSI